jgi:hypothetical protein
MEISVSIKLKRVWVLRNLNLQKNMNNSYFNLKVKLFRRFPWRFQSLIKFRPNGSKIITSKDAELIKKHFPINLNELKMPIHVEVELHENFKKLKIEEFHKHCSDFYVAKLSNIQVFDNYNVTTIIKNNKILQPLSFDPYKRAIHPSLTIFCYPKPIFLKGNTLVLSSPGAQNNYFHFTIDLIQKLAFAIECGFVIDDFDYILVNKLTYNFQKELLKIFGIPENKIIETIPDSFFYCENVAVPSYSPHNYFGFLQIKSIVLSKILSLKNKHSKRIYISRKNSSGRRIVNEKELIFFLMPFGFETVFLENLSVLEQAKLFNNVEIIITPHGAGTTNIIYSQKDTSLIEIHDVGAPLNVDFYPYISYLGINYGYMFAETIINPETDHFNFQDILVDIDKLKILLIKMNLLLSLK